MQFEDDPSLRLHLIPKRVIPWRQNETDLGCVWWDRRGLSNHFSGKSKSFNNLSEANLTDAVSSARDLEKPEHPFNKKRRILRWSKNINLLSTAKSMPLFPVSEDEDDAPDPREGDGGDGDGERSKAVYGRKHSVFKSSSCFALSDLHEEDEEAEDEEEEDRGN